MSFYCALPSLLQMAADWGKRWYLKCGNQAVRIRTNPPTGGCSNALAFASHASVTYAPARAKSPLHKRSLCNGCISLSNAEGLKERRIPPENPWTVPVKNAAMTTKILSEKSVDFLQSPYAALKIPTKTSVDFFNLNYRNQLIFSIYF